MMTRRQAIKTTVLASVALSRLCPAQLHRQIPPRLPPHPMGYSRCRRYLTPMTRLNRSLTRRTMHFHHDKHHAAYVAESEQSCSQQIIIYKHGIYVTLKKLPPY